MRAVQRSAMTEDQAFGLCRLWRPSTLRTPAQRVWERSWSFYRFRGRRLWGELRGGFWPPVAMVLKGQPNLFRSDIT